MAVGIATCSCMTRYYISPRICRRSPTSRCQMGAYPAVPWREQRPSLAKSAQTKILGDRSLWSSKRPLREHANHSYSKAQDLAAAERIFTGTAKSTSLTKPFPFPRPPLQFPIPGPKPEGARAVERKKEPEFSLGQNIFPSFVPGKTTLWAEIFQRPLSPRKRPGMENSLAQMYASWTKL